jgi:hypothetical protein
MRNLPETLEDAKKVRYGKWAGNSDGKEYKLDRCAFEVWRDFGSGQCSKKNGHGPDGLYCKSHANEYFPEITGEVMYRLLYGQIAEYKVVKKTEKTIWYLDEKTNKTRQDRLQSMYSKWFDTAKDAFWYLWNDKKRDVEVCERALKKSKEMLAEFELKHKKIIDKINANT